MIYRFDAPLIFANVATFREEVSGLARAEPKPHWIMIAAEPITDIDTTGGSSFHGAASRPSARFQRRS